MERENEKKLPTDLELWVDIQGYNGEYQLSNKGRVRSPERIIIMKNGSKRPLPYREQIIFVNTRGYLAVGLSKNKKQRQWLLHRLMAIHFIPNPENKPEVNHKNGIKTDASIRNLEWCTKSENTIHAFATGLMDIHGEKHMNAKLTEAAVFEIRKHHKTPKDIIHFAEKFGVSPTTIRDVIWKRTWTHI